MSNGPLLYPEGPEELHTGTPRHHNGLIIAIFGAVVVVAVAMVLLLPLIKGSPEEQAQQTATVFVTALDRGDTETAYGLLCDAERARLQPEQVAAAYEAALPGRVVGAQEAEVGGKPAVRVQVRRGDGSSGVLTLVAENGTRVCGVSRTG